VLARIHAAARAHFFWGSRACALRQALVEEVPAAAAMFKRASEILGYDLLKVCTEGPKEKLDSTEVRARSRSSSWRASRGAAG
jgi:hypothetical protein